MRSNLDFCIIDFNNPNEADKPLIWGVRVHPDNANVAFCNDILYIAIIR